MVVTGLGGNPVSILQNQTNLDLIPVKHKCPMYECSQNVVGSSFVRQANGDSSLFSSSLSGDLSDQSTTCIIDVDIFGLYRYIDFDISDQFYSD